MQLKISNRTNNKTLSNNLMDDILPIHKSNTTNDFNNTDDSISYILNGDQYNILDITFYMFIGTMGLIIIGIIFYLIYKSAILNKLSRFHTRHNESRYQNQSTSTNIDMNQLIYLTPTEEIASTSLAPEEIASTSSAPEEIASISSALQETKRF